MAYSPIDGNSIHDDYDFEHHRDLSIHVDVVELDGDGVLTTGIIQKFDDKSVTINDYTYNRHTHLFVSRPFINL